MHLKSIYLQEKRFPYLLNSKYCKVKHIVYSYEEGTNLLISQYGNEDSLPFVYTCDDFIESILDALNCANNKYTPLYSLDTQLNAIKKKNIFGLTLEKLKFILPNNFRFK